MSNLTVVIPYCQKDIQQAKTLLEWLNDQPTIGKYPACLLAADILVPHATKMELKALALKSFSFSETVIITVPEALQVWPSGPNFMFKEAAKHIEKCYKTPFLWLEPDATPIKEHWLEALQVAYDNSPKKYMGDVFETKQPGVPPKTMSGVAIYPQNASTELAEFVGSPIPWDMAMAPFVVPRCVDTPLIQNWYGTREMSPHFEETKEDGSQPNTVPMSFLEPEAVIFHRCKDGSLINCLRKRILKPEVVTVPTLTLPPIGTPEQKPAQDPPPVKRGPGRPRKEMTFPPPPPQTWEPVTEKS